MSRLISSFPNRFQGIGLFLLRLALAGGLIAEAVARLSEPITGLAFVAAGGALAGALLVIGVWTDIVAIAVCVLQLALLPLSDGAIEIRLLRVAVSLALILLGPGAWSVDARLFGRRRLEIKNLGGN